MAAPITTIDGLRRVLTSGETELLEHSADLSYLIGVVQSRLLNEGRDVRIDAGSINDQLEEYKTRHYQQQNFSGEQHREGALGEGLLELGESVLLPAMERKDTQSQIIQEFHESQRDSEATQDLIKNYGEMHTSLQLPQINDVPDKKLDEKQVEALAGRLSEITKGFETDELLQKDVTEFKTRLQNANALSPEVESHINDRFQKLQDRRKKEKEAAKEKFEKKNKGKEYVDPEKINTKALAERLLRAKSAEDRERILKNFIVERQGYTFGGLHYILTQEHNGILGRLGIGEKSLLSRDTRKTLLKKGAIERKERDKKNTAPNQKALAALRQFLNIRRRQIPRETPMSLPVSNTENPEYSPMNMLNNAGDVLQNLSPENLLGKLGQQIGNGLAQGAQNLARQGGQAIVKFVASNPIVLLVIGGLILILLIVFALVWATTSSSTTTPPGTGSCASQDPSTPDMVTFLQSQFNIQLHTTDSAEQLNQASNTVGETVYDLNADLVPQLYHTICKLSGYQFIQLLHLDKTHINIYQRGTQCTEKVNPPDATTTYNILVGPCGTPAGNEYLITHEFGHVIEYLNPGLFGKFCSDVYHGYVRGTGCIDGKAYPGTIATYNCHYDYTAYDSPDPWECFSDMVGSYFTYHDFIDSYNNLPTDANKMANYPANFPDYYNFATNNIFVPISQPQEDNTCNGEYRLTNPLQANFGDPQCDFDKNRLYIQLKQLDSKNANFWFNDIVGCESGFNPTVWTNMVGGVHTPAPDGAWGLFQMGSHMGQAGDVHQYKNGAYDYGDVIWGEQAVNAIDVYKAVGWAYWGCAKIHGR